MEHFAAVVGIDIDIDAVFLAVVDIDIDVVFPALDADAAVQ